MYSEGSALDKASTIGISLTPPLIFTGGGVKKNLASFKTSLKFAPHAFENAARYPKSETKVQCCDVSMSLPSLVKLGSCTLRKLCQSCPTPKIARRKRARSSITQRWIIRFRSNFVRSLSAWHPKCYKRSRSRGRRSRSQRDITCAKIPEVINNSGIARFRSNFVQTLMTWRLLYTTKFQGQGDRGQGHNMT